MGKKKADKKVVKKPKKEESKPIDVNSDQLEAFLKLMKKPKD